MEDGKLRRCPYCAELIQSAAIKCRYCGEAVSPGSSRQPTVESRQSFGIGIAAIVLGLGGVILPYFAAVFLVPAALLCALIAYRRGLHRMGITGIVLSVIGVVGIVYTSQKITQITRDPFDPEAGQSAFGAPPVVTKAEYDQIQEGMTYGQVRAIIGSPGEELSRSDLAGYTTVMYSWRNSSGANMNAMFQNERLVNKAQFGLR